MALESKSQFTYKVHSDHILWLFHNTTNLCDGDRGSVGCQNRAGLGNVAKLAEDVEFEVSVLRGSLCE